MTGAKTVGASDIKSWGRAKRPGACEDCIWWSVKEQRCTAAEGEFGECETDVNKKIKEWDGSRYETMKLKLRKVK